LDRSGRRRDYRQPSLFQLHCHLTKIARPQISIASFASSPRKTSASRAFLQETTDTRLENATLPKVASSGGHVRTGRWPTCSPRLCSPRMVEVIARRGGEPQVSGNGCPLDPPGIQNWGGGTCFYSQTDGTHPPGRCQCILLQLTEPETLGHEVARRVKFLKTEGRPGPLNAFARDARARLEKPSSVAGYHYRGTLSNARNFA
jgi:hypothetical protein